MKICLVLVLLGYGSAFAQMKGESRFGIHQYSFISNDIAQDQIRNVSFVSFAYQSESFFDLNKEKEPGFKVRLQGNYSTNSSLFSDLNVKDLFYQKDRFKVGRSTFEWSYLDENWQFGFFQPQYKSRTFLSESQGLIGFFIGVPLSGSHNPMDLELFASPLYIPDQGPNYKLEEGQFVSHNPWFLLPPSTAYVPSTGVTDDIRYRIKIPPLHEVALKSSLGGRLTIGDFKTQNQELRLSAMTKPNSKVNLGAEVYARTNQSVFVDIMPLFEEQKLFAMDYRLRIKNLIFHLGYLDEKSNLLQANSDLTYTYTTDRSLMQASLQTKNVWGEFKVSYLNPLQQSEPLIFGPQKNELESILKAQTWKPSAQYQLEWTTEGRLQKKPYHLNLKYRQDLSAELKYIGLNWGIKLDPQWTLSLGSELIKAQIENKNYSRYDNLDWAQVGVQYVF